MRIHTLPALFSSLLFLILSSGFQQTVFAGIVSGNQWLIKSGDTLYAISRAVFPKDRRMQGRLRRDIAVLNPKVFKNGPGGMKIGMLLKLPDYVNKNAKVKPKPKPKQQPKAATLPAPVTPVVSPKPRAQVAPRNAPISQPVKPQDSSANLNKSESNKTSVPESRTTVNTEASSISPIRHGWSLSAGYSAGGDVLVSVVGGHDIYGGSGMHIRLGFEGLPQAGKGYRLALGYQYDLVKADNGDTSFSDLYLQLAFQYRVTNMVYGIGIVSHTGPTLEINTTTTTTTEFGSASGPIIYMEYPGDGNTYALGLSYTSIEYEESGVTTPTPVDGSQFEVYYSWKF